MKSLTLSTAALLLLSACAREEPESVEAQADTLAAQLENRADELTAEAENEVNASAAELEAEFADFGNVADGNAAGNSTAE